MAEMIPLSKFDSTFDAKYLIQITTSGLSCLVRMSYLDGHIEGGALDVVDNLKL